MRIAALLSLCLLTACASGAPVANVPASSPSIYAAQKFCLDKGYEPASFEYDVCYRNRPEVQAQGRSQRLNSMNVIHDNRSPRTYRGRSYPVQ